MMTFKFYSENVPDNLNALIRAAQSVKFFSYSPYSKFKVGCAVHDEYENIHYGCNIENASYSATVCAERVALYRMISCGSLQAKTLVLITDSEEPSFPCASCLQVMSELASPNLEILSLNKDASLFKRAYLKDLYPHPFKLEGK